MPIKNTYAPPQPTAHKTTRDTVGGQTYQTHLSNGESDDISSR